MLLIVNWWRNGLRLLRHAIESRRCFCAERKLARTQTCKGRVRSKLMFVLCFWVSRAALGIGFTADFLPHFGVSKNALSQIPV
jgi:hypothetical protein